MLPFMYPNDPHDDPKMADTVKAFRFLRDGKFGLPLALGVLIVVALLFLFLCIK